MKIIKVEVIYEFKDAFGMSCGAYSVTLNNVTERKRVFVKNGNAVGIVTHLTDESAPEMTLSLKRAFLELVENKED